MRKEEAQEKALSILLPNATEFQKIAIAELHRSVGDLSKGMPTPGSVEEQELAEMGRLALEALER